MNSIGQFGVGFKSVFAVTKTPCIHSGAYHLKINDYIVPEQVDPLDIEEQDTIIKLPFNHDEMSPGDAHSGISQILEKELKSESLLFLRNIRKIIWQTTSNTGEYSVESNGTRAKLIARINQQDHVTNYLMFEKDLKMDKKRKLCKRRVAIEPIIGHSKSDFRLSRNRLKGQIGDEINVLMAACA